MAAPIDLPPAYVWHADEHGQHTLLLKDCPIVTVGPMGAGWLIRVVLKGHGIEPLEYAVRSLDRGKGWAQRWVKQRERMVARACGQPVEPSRPLSSTFGGRRKAA